eukprot:10423968-Heterocapsa_arctica.AAC.1
MCLALGSGMEEDEEEQSYYGPGAVLRDLQTAPGYQNGLVDLSKRGPRRDQHTGNIICLRFDTTGDDATMTGARGSQEDYHAPDDISTEGLNLPYHQALFANDNQNLPHYERRDDEEHQTRQGTIRRQHHTGHDFLLPSNGAQALDN